MREYQKKPLSPSTRRVAIGFPGSERRQKLIQLLDETIELDIRSSGDETLLESSLLVKKSIQDLPGYYTTVVEDYPFNWSAIIRELGRNN